jgi:phosphotriesterase-related protein
MLRRTLLSGTLVAGLSLPGRTEDKAIDGMVMTVRGPVKPSALGLMLAHEHLFSNFGGDPAEWAAYEEEALMAAVLPYLVKVRQMGCDSIADATAAWFGRRPDLLQKLSIASGIHVLTNTGYYGAANDRYVPRSAYEESADAIAARWTKEFREGIGEQKIRPGFLKIGVDEGPLSEIDRKLIAAAAKTHKQTGLTIAVHTGGNPEAARQQVAILRAEGVSPSAWIWVHANSTLDAGELLWAAEQGAWISLDGLEEASIDRHYTLLDRLRQAGRLRQVLLSHDGNSFRATGRPPKAYEALFTHFLPRLKTEKFTEAEVRMLTQDNPQRAYTIGKRPL